MAFTVANLKEEIKGDIWPNGVPENLVTPINRFFVQALNFLQQNVPCLLDEHLDFTHQCDTYFYCGLTVMDKPDGVIKRLFTVQYENYCDPVDYTQVNPPDVRRWSRGFMSFVDAPANAGLDALPLAFKFSESSTDDMVNGRAMTGFWAIDRTRLLIAPWLQSYEAVGIDWEGYKNKWADTDTVLEAEDFKRAVKLYVQREYAKDFERDLVMRQTFHDDLMGNEAQGIIGAVPLLIFQCHEKRKIQQAAPVPAETAHPTPEEVERLILTYDTPVASDVETDTTVLAVIGDYGLDGQPEIDVANLVKSWKPDAILTVGNNNYPAGAASTIDANVGKHFFEYIYPYTGDYGVERPPNRFWPTLGNRDLDAADLTPYTNYFTLPNNERYYDKIVGHVHAFLINSGYNTAGTLKEADGNTESSTQGNWIVPRAIRSTVKWRLAFFHHPPFTSTPQDGTFGRYPGVAPLRWDWPGLGFHAVFSGHSPNYERIEVNGFPYFVNGAGGATALVAFSGPKVDGSQKRYSDNYGAIKISATCDKLTVEFYNRKAELVDTKEITGLPVVSTATPGDLVPLWNPPDYTPSLQCATGTQTNGYTWTIADAGGTSKQPRYPSSGNQASDPNSILPADLLTWWQEAVLANFVAYVQANGLSVHSARLYWDWDTSGDSWNVVVLHGQSSFLSYISAGWTIKVAYCLNS